MSALIILAAILAYDILLMFGREKQYIWDSKFRTSTVLYALVRYPVVFYQVYQICMHPTSTRVRNFPDYKMNQEHLWHTLVRFTRCA